MAKKSEYIRLNLGSVLISRQEWDRAKLICGYGREEIRSTIVGNGMSALSDSIDTSDFCEHNLPVSAGVCGACDKINAALSMNTTLAKAGNGHSVCVLCNGKVAYDELCECINEK